MCFITETPPSQIGKIYWARTYEDINFLVRTRIGYEQAQVLQEYQTLVTVAGLIFGEEKPKPASTANEVEASLTDMFGAGAVGD